MTSLSDIAVDTQVVLYTLGIYAAIVVSPGPNFAVILRLALQGQQRRAQGAVAGLALAATFYAVLAMVGLSAILAEIGGLARVVQVAGGLFLIYLGLSGWKRPAHGGPPQEPVTATATAAQGVFGAGLRLGLMVNLSNPKAIAFFVGLYAVAVPVDATWATRLAILIGGAMLELCWYTLVIAVLSRPTPRSLYARFSLMIERLLGTVLILFGIRLVTDK